MKIPSYWVCVITKNGAQTIGQTLDSITKQSVPPDLVVVVDDGSSDDTPSLVKKRAKAANVKIELIRLPDKGYDIRRVPANINEAYAYVEKTNAAYQYSMITGDDCVFPANYCEHILSRMQDEHAIAIASGDWGVPPPPDMVKAPQGAGRIIREELWRKVGGRYPVAYGWETWLLFRAMQLGYRIANFTELRYEHLRPSGTEHKFAHWGIAMRTLGYYPPMVFLRFVKNLVLGSEPISVRGNLSMVTAYIFPPLRGDDPYYSLYDERFREYVRRQQIDRVRKFIGRFFSKYF